MTTQPDWYIRINKTYVVTRNLDQNSFKIATRAGKTNISGFLKITKSKGLFLIQSTLYHTIGCTDHCERILSEQEFKLMFGMSDECLNKQDELFAEKHEGNVAVPGKFIRSENKVSFPCPGRKSPCDPNFQFEISDAIKKKAEKLVAT